MKNLESAPAADLQKVRVADRMTRAVITIAPSESCQRALFMMHEASINHLPVLEGKRLVGIITERDIYRRSPQQAAGSVGAIQKKLLSVVNVGGVMTYAPVTVPPSVSVKRAVEVMLEYRVGCLPVVRNGRLIGILTTRDAIGLLAGVSNDAAAANSIGDEEEIRRVRRNDAQG